MMIVRRNIHLDYERRYRDFCKCTEGWIFSTKYIHLQSNIYRAIWKKAIAMEREYGCADCQGGAKCKAGAVYAKFWISYKLEESSWVGKRGKMRRLLMERRQSVGKADEVQNDL